MNDLPILGHGAFESKKSVQDIYAHQILDMAVMPPQEINIEYSHPHFNQRAVGICTAADMVDMARKIWGIEFSVDFLYWGGKGYDGNLGEGSSNLSMLRYWKNVGLLPASMDAGCNNTHGTFQDFLGRKKNYTAEQIAEASKYKISAYGTVLLDPIGFATALASSKYGIITRTATGNNWYTPSWSKSDLELLRAPNPITGGHSVKVTYTKGLDEKQLRKNRNTWGDKDNPTVDANYPIWSDDGDIMYEYDTQQSYVTEAYVVSVEPVIFTHLFTVPILSGFNSPEVTALQRVLVGLGFLTMPQGVSFGYYGQLTAQAVLAFQKANNVAPMAVLEQLAGKSVGPATRKALNKAQGI